MRFLILSLVWIVSPALAAELRPATAHEVQDLLKGLPLPGNCAIKKSEYSADQDWEKLELSVRQNRSETEILVRQWSGHPDALFIGVQEFGLTRRYYFYDQTEEPSFGGFSWLKMSLELQVSRDPAGKETLNYLAIARAKQKTFGGYRVSRVLCGSPVVPARPLAGERR